MAMSCPICKLSADDIGTISEGEAKTLIASLQQKGGWCFDHIFAFTDLAKRFPFEAREWLREMVIGTESIEV